VWFACLVGCAALTAGCEPPDLPGKPDPAERPLTPSQVLAFDELFAHNCAGCHGAEGKLGPAPPLNDSLFLHIASADQLKEAIANGRKGTPMPAFAHANGGTLTDEQIAALADGLIKHWKTNEKFVEPLPTYLAKELGSDADNAGLVERGKEVFARACATCHGENGVGEEGGMGPINDRDFLALISNQALRRIVITGRHDLGMPNYSQDDARPADFKPLSDSQIDELVALLASWRTSSSAESKKVASQR
jgi:cytochrome c oxidase cbb3-type subunit 3/ubiquinol-cytochrome c reductase cytochrome c subunit